MILTSSNGIDWNKNNPGINQTLYDIVYGNNQFLAVGNEGIIITSTNAINWNIRTAGINTSLLNAAYGNSIFVIVGQDGKILTGTDETGWVVRDSLVRDDLNGTAYGNSLFTAVGEGNILYSLCDTTSSTANIINELPEILKLLSKITNNFINNNKKGARNTSLQLISPNGAEVLHPGEKALITWESNENIENVKLEYSPDNGSTYLTIINNFMPPAARGDSFCKNRPPGPPAKTFDYFDGLQAATQEVIRNCYEWQVPHHISANCLIRISNAHGFKISKYPLLYELKFKITGSGSFESNGELFSIRLGDAANPAVRDFIPAISFNRESNGSGYIRFNDETIKNIPTLTDQWHLLHIFIHQETQLAALWLNGEIISENFVLKPGLIDRPAVSFDLGVGGPVNLEIDDLSVYVLDTTPGKNRFIALFKEDFERYKQGDLPGNSGWKTTLLSTGETKKSIDSKAVFIDKDYLFTAKTMKIQASEGNRVIAVKNFDLSVNLPFDTSDKPFEIRYNNDMNSDAAVQEPVDIYPGFGGHGTSGNYSYSAPAATSGNSKTTTSRVQDTTLVDTYYIYSYDGKLLAQYDHNGNCVRDYIYAGNRLIAEYYPPPIDKYYYYMPDQVNSVRIVTDDIGEVVYSAAYGPYGEVEKVWNNAYEPKLKFSGKERDEYTNLDYFGARYYNHKHYRFNSVDPVINKGEALYNPQLWNLYTYCRNNPISYFDPDGRQSENQFGWFWIQHKIIQEGGEGGIQTVQGMNYFVGMASVGMSAAIAGYFAGPEIISAVCASGASALQMFKKGGNKIANFFSRLLNIINSRTRQAIDYILKNPNKMEHIFNSKHNLNILVQKFGSKENVIRAAVNSLGKLPNGVFEVIRNIGGANVTIRGIVIDKVPKIGTMFIIQ